MLRRRSIRMRIIVLVLVPVIALVGLYAVALSLTLSSFLALKQAADVRNAVTNPVTDVQLQLSRERGFALQYLADPTHAKLLALLGQEPKTGEAISDYLDAAKKANHAASQRWATALATLPALRETVVSSALSRAAAAASYSTLIADADFVLTLAVSPVLTTSALIQANGVLTMEESLQAVAEERDLFTADLTTHSYPAADNKLISQLIADHRELWDQGTESLDRPFLKLFATDIPATTSAALRSLENQILSSPRGAMRVSASAWTSVNNAYAADFRKALYSSSTELRANGFAEARTVFIRLILIGGLGLLAIVAAIAVAIVLSRELLQQLDDLRKSALDLSSVRLPTVLARLRSGEDIDASTETPQLDAGTNEIGQLGRAFNIAAEAAVSAAVDEAEIRRGVNDVFRNLARRNQSLLTRQLELLDAMERRVHDPEELADLFRVDHLTTRMRRHAEGLLIVAGGSSGRVWREPVPIVDVMRAAVAEIEDYTRIRVTSRSSSSVAGHAVADIIHMLAEIIENATTFSPANTPVRIESDNVAKGLIVEIEDRGLGMTEIQIKEINSKLNDPPLLDLSGSEQLGLFIAGQLARRHEVKITMRGSAYGGITAVVLIPSTLVIDPGYDEPLTVVGIRELGGRPVPQLPAPSTADDEIAASVGSTTSPDYVSATGYLLDLETAAGPVTTTAAQIDTAQVDAGQIDAVQATRDGAGLYGGTADTDLYGTGERRIELYGTGPLGPFAEEPAAAEVVSAEVVSAEVVSADGLDDAADGELAGLKGAGAWLAEAQAATPPEPAGEPAAGPATAAPPTPSTPMLMLGPHSDPDLSDVPTSTPAPTSSALTGAESGRMTEFGPIESSVSSAGWPSHSDWRHLAGGPASGEGLPQQGAPHLDLSSNGSRDVQGDGSATDHSPLPLRRQPRTDEPAPTPELGDTDNFGPAPSEPSPLELDGLPVRVRQANIAPQLRDQTRAAQAHQYVAAPEMPGEQAITAQAATVEPSPEAARSFMSALQRGWERGRSMAEHMTDEPDAEQ